MVVVGFLLPLISVQAKPPPSGRVEGKILLGPSAAEVDGKGVVGLFFHADEPSIRLFLSLLPFWAEAPSASERPKL